MGDINRKEIEDIIQLVLGDAGLSEAFLETLADVVVNALETGINATIPDSVAVN